MAKTPEQSGYTSIQERIAHPDSSYLAPFSEQGNGTLPFSLEDYLELVDRGGRKVKCNKLREPAAAKSQARGGPG